MDQWGPVEGSVLVVGKLFASRRSSSSSSQPFHMPSAQIGQHSAAVAAAAAEAAGATAEEATTGTTEE